MFRISSLHTFALRVLRTTWRKWGLIGLYRAARLLLLLTVSLVFSAVFAQNINLLPKYGLLPKNDAQKQADARFLASVDERTGGNRKRAAQEVATLGWQFLSQGNTADAMRRFNQSWLLDHSNGSALWGMATIQVRTGKFDESLALFAEATPVVGDDIDFLADYARAVGIAGAQRNDPSMLDDAWARFERIYQRDSEHTLNLQNWAITHFYMGNYAEAWQKLKLAEATPRHEVLDAKFLDALQSKMPRP